MEYDDTVKRGEAEQKNTHKKYKQVTIRQATYQWLLLKLAAMSKALRAASSIRRSH